MSPADIRAFDLPVWCGGCACNPCARVCTRAARGSAARLRDALTRASARRDARRCYDARARNACQRMRVFARVTRQPRIFAGASACARKQCAPCRAVRVVGVVRCAKRR